VLAGAIVGGVGIPAEAHTVVCFSKVEKEKGVVMLWAIVLVLMW